MGFGSRRLVLVFGTIIFVGLIGGFLTTASADELLFDERVEGVTVEPPADTEDEMLEQVEDAADELSGFSDPTNVAVLYSDDKTYLVVSEEEIKTGDTVATGTVVETSDGSVIFADEVETSTRGDRVSAEELEANPEAYDRELVRVTMDYQQVALNAEAAEGSIVSQLAFGTHNERPNELGVVPPGEAGVWTAAELSENGEADLSSGELSSRLGESSILVAGTGETRYWTDAEVTLDLVVLSDTSGTIHVADMDVVSQQVDEIEEIHTGNYDGEVVTIETDATEASISTKETLVNALPCGTDAFYVGASCVPAVTDAVVHAGVLYDDPTPTEDEMLLYAGISNEVQTVPVDTQHRRMAITGEVVSASEIDPELDDGRALVVYDVNYINHNHDEPPNAAVNYRENAQDRVQEQMLEAAEEDEETEIDIVDVEYPDQHDGTARITVTLENRGEADGEKEVRIRTGGSSSPNFQETVTVEAGETQTVTYTHELSESTGVALYVNDERYGFIDSPDDSSDDDGAASDDQSSEPETADEEVDSDTSIIGSIGLIPVGFGLAGLTLFLSAAVLDGRRYYRYRKGKSVDVPKLQLGGLVGASLLCAQMTAWTVGGSDAVFVGGLLGLVGSGIVSLYGCSEGTMAEMERPPVVAVVSGLIWLGISLPLAEILDSNSGRSFVGLTIMLGGLLLMGGIIVEALRRIKHRRGCDVSTDVFETVTVMAFGGVAVGIGGLVFLTSGAGALFLLLMIAVVTAWFGTLFWLIYKMI